MLNIRNKLFGENESKIEYLTFEYLFENKNEHQLGTSINTRHGKQLVFLYKLIPGITESSFAINIAKQMGLPHKITDRATQLLNLFDDNSRETEETSNRFHLLNTNESEANLNE